MPKVKIIVWHTFTGKIIAVGEPTSDYEITSSSETTQAVLVTEIDEELLDGLHQTHEVDLNRRALVKRQ